MTAFLDELQAAVAATVASASGRRWSASAAAGAAARAS